VQVVLALLELAQLLVHVPEALVVLLLDAALLLLAAGLDGLELLSRACTGQL
jgi:hypothetical protein